MSKDFRGARKLCSIEQHCTFSETCKLVKCQPSRPQQLCIVLSGRQCYRHSKPQPTYTTGPPAASTMSNQEQGWYLANVALPSLGRSLEQSYVIRSRTVCHWKFKTPPQNCSSSAILWLLYLVLISFSVLYCFIVFNIVTCCAVSCKWMMKWNEKCEDFKCVWKPTESRLCLTHYVNKSSRWAVSVSSLWTYDCLLLELTFCVNCRYAEVRHFTVSIRGEKLPYTRTVQSWSIPW